MRISYLRTSLLVVGAMVASACVVPARGGAEVGVVAHSHGPELMVYAYSSSFYGDWRAHYMGWTPVTIYYFEGRYYSRPIPRARTVIVYRRGGDYFFPPRDRAWRGFDRRYDYSRAPSWRDHGRAKHKEDRGRGRGRGRP
jgi:hypothetical protein